MILYINCYLCIYLRVTYLYISLPTYFMSNYISLLFMYCTYLKRDENGEWRGLHNEELLSLYCSPNIVRVIKSRRLRWAGNVARMEESRSDFKMLTVKPTFRET